jgi:hypothetical protein
LPQGIVPAVEKWFGVKEAPRVSAPIEAKMQDAP